MNTPKRVGPEPAPAAAPKPALPLIVFDLDGVLVEVSASYRQAIVDTVAALGGGMVTADEVQTLKNDGGYNNDWDLSQELLRRRGMAVEMPRIVEVFNRSYLGPQGDGTGGLIEKEHWLLPPELLAQLRRRFRLAIFTGRPRFDANYVLRRFGVAEAFDHVVTHEDVQRQKPDPEGLIELRARHAPAPIAFYVGDSVDDARCAAAAAVPFIAILPRQQLQRERLQALFEECGCLRIVPDAAAAVHVLLGLD